MSASRFRMTFLSLFFLFILAVPGFWLVSGKQTGEYSIVEERNLETFPQLSLPSFLVAMKATVLGNFDRAGEFFFNQFLRREFQSRSELAASDHFPLRLEAIKLVKALERAQIRVAYALLPDTALPSDMSSGYYVMRDGSRLLAAPAVFNDEKRAAIDSGIQNYRQLSKAFPQLNISIFYIQRLEDSEFYPLNGYIREADGGRSIAYFEQQLPAGISLQKMMLSSYKDFADTSFTTDHHWNSVGACRGYELIFALLSENYPDIPPKRTCADFAVIPGLQFLGSYARETLYPIAPEPFEVSLSPLPPYTILLNGQEVQHTKIDKYMAGDFSRLPYVNHYARIYGSLSDPIEYNFPGNPPRNLLLIGSSYRAPIEAFIASHYSHTYIVDPRYAPDFSLGDFLADHQVDDLLILGHDSAVFGLGEWQIQP